MIHFERPIKSSGSAGAILPEFARLFYQLENSESENVTIPRSVPAQVAADFVTSYQRLLTPVIAAELPSLSTISQSTPHVESFDPSIHNQIKSVAANRSCPLAYSSRPICDPVSDKTIHAIQSEMTNSNYQVTTLIGASHELATKLQPELRAQNLPTLASDQIMQRVDTFCRLSAKIMGTRVINIEVRPECPPDDRTELPHSWHVDGRGMVGQNFDIERELQLGLRNRRVMLQLVGQPTLYCCRDPQFASEAELRLATSTHDTQRKKLVRQIQLAESSLLQALTHEEKNLIDAYRTVRDRVSRLIRLQHTPQFTTHTSDIVQAKSGHVTSLWMSGSGAMIAHTGDIYGLEPRVVLVAQLPSPKLSPPPKRYKSPVLSAPQNQSTRGE